MKEINKLDNAIALVGSVVLFAGLLLQFMKFEFAPYVYLVGAILFAWIQVKYGYEGKNIVIRRLRKQQLIGAMVLVLTGVVMLLWHRNEWIVCLSIASVLELYTAFRIPQEEEKEKNR